MKPEGRISRTGNRQSREPVRFFRDCICAARGLLLCASLGVAATATAQTNVEPPSSGSRFTIRDFQPEISLLTIGPGEIFFERFGHNAIVVRDPARGEALAYNYGIFDFDQQHFLLNFARGRMLYRMAVDVLADDLDMYRAEGRSITEQRLDLDPDQARRLVDFLEWNARPGNAQYRYDYFEANCSTRVRDALDKALGGALQAQSEGRSRGYTWRLDALRLMAPEPMLMLGIDLGLGPFADQRIDFWQESFVPETLAQLASPDPLTHADRSVRPLVSATTTLASGRVEQPPSLPPDLRVPFLLLGLARRPPAAVDRTCANRDRAYPAGRVRDPVRAVLRTRRPGPAVPVVRHRASRRLAQREPAAARSAVPAAGAGLVRHRA